MRELTMDELYAVSGGSEFVVTSRLDAALGEAFKSAVGGFVGGLVVGGVGGWFLGGPVGTFGAAVLGGLGGGAAGFVSGFAEGWIFFEVSESEGQAAASGSSNDFTAGMTFETWKYVAPFVGALTPNNVNGE